MKKNKKKKKQKQKKNKEKTNSPKVTKWKGGSSRDVGTFAKGNQKRNTAPVLGNRVGLGHSLGGLGGDKEVKCRCSYGW